MRRLKCGFVVSVLLSPPAAVPPEFKPTSAQHRRCCAIILTACGCLQAANGQALDDGCVTFTSENNKYFSIVCCIWAKRRIITSNAHGDSKFATLDISQTPARRRRWATPE